MTSLCAFLGGGAVQPQILILAYYPYILSFNSSSGILSSYAVSFFECMTTLFWSKTLWLLPHLWFTTAPIHDSLVYPRSNRIFANVFSNLQLVGNIMDTLIYIFLLQKLKLINPSTFAYITSYLRSHCLVKQVNLHFATRILMNGCVFSQSRAFELNWAPVFFLEVHANGKTFRCDETSNALKEKENKEDIRLYSVELKLANLTPSGLGSLLHWVLWKKLT